MPGIKKAKGKITKALEALISTVPGTSEKMSKDPASRVKDIIRAAALQAAAVSGTLAIPPGPLGIVTIVPDLLLIWRIQARMVADIAGAHGKSAYLSRELVLYCMFKHSASQLLKDLVVRTGERVLVKRAVLKSLQQLLEKLGVKITQRLLGRAIARWLPLIGAVGVGAYAFYDTIMVGKNAEKVFQAETIEEI